ncbi:MAG: hypothetical protein WBL95_20600 [Microcoleus sp.]
MTEVTAISAQAAALLLHYGFDLGGYKSEKLVMEWLTKYPHQWLRLAVVEALYQGRYKAVSVEQILSMWQRLGQPLYHFNGEFERLVCNKFPQDLTVESDAKQAPEKIFLPTAASDVGVPELDLLPPPEPECDRVQHPEFPELKTQEIEASSAVNRTGETAEVVIYEEDLAVTAVADQAEADREFAEKSVAKIAPIVKHTDFHSKLTAIAREGKRKKGERRKKL